MTSVFLLMALAAGAQSAYAQSAGPNHAGVVIQYASGKVGSKCVAFTEANISGYELLRRSGLPLVAQPSSMGVAVCSINGTGCANSANCFCQCQTPGEACAYWTFFEQTAQKQWRLSALGAAAISVKNGGLQAWVWGNGDSQNVTMIPPALGFDEVCGESALAPTPSPSRREGGTSTGAPTRKATSAPAPTPIQQEKETPSPTPIILADLATDTPIPNPTQMVEETPTRKATSSPTSNPSQMEGSGYLAFFGICAGLLGVAVLRKRR